MLLLLKHCLSFVPSRRGALWPRGFEKRFARPGQNAVLNSKNYDFGSARRQRSSRRERPEQNWIPNSTAESCIGRKGASAGLVGRRPLASLFLLGFGSLPLFPLGFGPLFGPRPPRTANIGPKSGQDHQHKPQERPKTANRGPKRGPGPPT